MVIESNKQIFTSGERLKFVRSLLRISRSYLQEKYGLPEATLKSWENGTTKITLAGATRCVEVYRKEGLIINEDWIIEGIGLDPKKIAVVSNYFSFPSKQMFAEEDDDEISMIKDANAFKQNHSNAVVMIVSNEDMRPFYWPGSYVGGRLYSGIDIVKGLNKDCIIYLKNGERFFRRLIRNKISKYNLTCLNPNENSPEPVLYNVEIESVAPVIWHRWKNSY